MTTAAPDERSLQFQVASVLEARRVKAEVLKKHGGKSRAYLDARDLVKHHEGRLLAMTIRMFAPEEGQGSHDAN